MSGQAKHYLILIIHISHRGVPRAPWSCRNVKKVSYVGHGGRSNADGTGAGHGRLGRREGRAGSSTKAGRALHVARGFTDNFCNGSNQEVPPFKRRLEESAENKTVHLTDLGLRP